MNNIIRISVNEFINNIEVARQQLSKNNLQITQKEENIKKAILDFAGVYNKFSVPASRSNFKQQLQQTLDMYQKLFSTWTEMIQKSIDGKEFINQFEKSVIVIVFGNVNVGKSSIGNFISHSNQYIGKKDWKNPDFFVYDLGERNNSKAPVKIQKGMFRENAIEETRSIQYFTLNNAFTWVDTPGIHSINNENEQLAKQYVNFADLVIFVMSSSSPGKYDEFMEVNRLIEKEKSLLVILNKSDRYEEDQVENEVVKLHFPKSDVDRQRQEGYVKSFYEQNKEKIQTKGIDCTSISLLLAKEAIEKNDSKLFKDSALDKLYEKFGETLKNNAIELKMKAPKSRINSLIDDICCGFRENDIDVNGVTHLINNFNILQKKIVEQQYEIKGLKDKIFNNVKIKAAAKINQIISHASYCTMAGSSRINLSEEIENIVLDILNEEIAKQMERLFNEYHDNSRITLSLDINAIVEAKYETQSYVFRRTEQIKRPPEGLLENFCSLIFKTQYYNNEIRERDEQIKYRVGDNSNEVMQNIFSELGNKLLPQIEVILKDISENYFNIEAQLISQILKAMNNLYNSLQNEKLY